jgi:uncharacterized membrane protein
MSMSSSTARDEHGSEDGRPSRPGRWRWLGGYQPGAWWLIAATCCLAGYQLVVHWQLARGGAGSWIALTPLLAAVLLAWRTALRWPAVLLAAACAAWLWLRPGTVPGALLAVHMTIYLGLMWMFARTLRPGREPMVTAIARRVRGSLPPEIAGYTRRVTQAWCGFFAGMVLASAALFLFAPLPVWSLFVNLLNLPLIAAMFGGEYLVRITRFRHLRHFPITAAARAFRAGGCDKPPA